MTDHTIKYQLTNFELFVLNSFFLSLPLSPMISNEESMKDEDYQTGLQEAVQSLIDKGYIQSDKDQKSGTVVLPELAQQLSDIAYSNQMVHLYLQRKKKGSCQIAYYHHSGRFAAQELFENGHHEIHQAEDLGQTLIDELVKTAPEGQRGRDTQIPLAAWNDLLRSRENHIEAEVLNKLAFGEKPGDDEDALRKREFIRDVLMAEKILILTAQTDRPQNEEEKVSLVITKKDNWLVVESYRSGEEINVQALEVPRKSLSLAVESIFADLESAISNNGREA